MLDLQALDAGRPGIFRLHPGDHAPALVAQFAGLVEIGVVARRDEAAVAGHERRFGDERCVEQIEERVVTGQAVRGGGEVDRQIDAGERRGDGVCRFQPAPDRGQVARAAAVERQARQRPVDVRRLAQGLAE